MRTPRWCRIGLVLALLVMLSGQLVLPGSAFAQDEDGAPADVVPSGDADAEPAVEDEIPPPPPDTTPPSLDQPGDVYAAAVDGAGTVVEYGLPNAFDETDGSVGVDCAPGSGLVFPLGTTVVTCSAGDAAGNWGQTAFAVTVTDQTPPQISGAGDVVVDAADASGAVVDFVVPAAWDNVDGVITAGCDTASGAVFPIGTTVVTCWAQDLAGNAAEPVAFAVTVNPPPEPTATEPPAPTQDPSPTETPTERPTDVPGTDTTPSPTEEPTKPSGEPTPTITPTADGVTSDPPTAPTPEALAVPDALLGSFTLVTDGGPLLGLAAIWGGGDAPISQEFGHTGFSITHHSWYAYGADYGLDGYEHPGLDIGIPAGTALYSPVDGVVQIAGGVPVYTFYGNGNPGVGELLIETDDGNEVILGHMGRIVVEAGQAVKAGQFVGLSGGENGDHLHLETREPQAGGYRIVDPRTSFLVPALKAATGPAAKADAKYAKITVRRVNCAVDRAGNAVADCGSDVLSGALYTVYNPTNHGRTRATNASGETSFGPRAGNNVLTKEVNEETFAGAYVSCVTEDSGRVLFQGPIADPSVTLNTEPGDRVVCTWSNLAADASAS